MTCTDLSFQWGSFSIPVRATSDSATARAESINVGLSLRIVSSGLKLSAPSLNGASRMMRSPLAARCLLHVACKSPFVSKHTTDPRKYESRLGIIMDTPFPVPVAPTSRTWQ